MRVLGLSITAGGALLAAGMLGVLCLNAVGWPPGFGAAAGAGVVRHPSAPFVVFCLALLVLAMGSTQGVATGLRFMRGITTGAVVYAAGSLFQFVADPGAWLLPVGAFAASVGALFGARGSFPGERSGVVRRLLVVVAVGLALEGVLALNAVAGVGELRGFLGGEDEIRQRLLRLARVAAVILPILAMRAAELRERCPVEGRAGSVTSWLTWGLAVGAAGMPLVLALAALVDLRLKYLLPIPADLTLAGTLTGVWLTFRHGALAERWGWLLIAASMTVGMLMGGYAFDGPLPSPVGHYSAPARTLMRNWHAALIVLGIVLLLSSDRRPERLNA